jgi:uncharacterized membrane protein
VHEPALYLLAVVFVLAIATFVRVRGIDEESLWYDEIWHLTLSSGHGSSFRDVPLNQFVNQLPDVVHIEHAAPWYLIPRRMDQVLHPPLFHLVLRGWREIAGDSVTALRGLSTGFSVLAVLLTLIVTRTNANRAAALLAGAIVAFSATQVMQAQDGRSYTMLAALGLATLLMLVRLAARGKDRIATAGVAIGCLAMMFTHYFAAGACLGVGAIVLWKLRRRARWETLAALLAAAGLWAILWLPTLREQLAHVRETADVFLVDPGGGEGHVSRTLMRLAALPLNLLADDPNAAAAPPPRMMIGLCIWAPAIASAVLRPAARVPLVFALFTIAPVVALDLARGTLHLSYVRYVMLSAAPLWIAIAMLAVGNRSMLAIVPAALFVLSAAMMHTAYDQGRANFRPLCREVEKAVGKSDVPLVIWSNTPRGRDGQSLYLYLRYYTRVFPRTTAIFNRPIDRESLQPIDQHEIVIAGTRSIGGDGDAIDVVEGKTVQPFGVVARTRTRAPPR